MIALTPAMSLHAVQAEELDPGLELRAQGGPVSFSVVTLAHDA